MKTTTNKPGVGNPVCIKCGLHKKCKSPFMKASGNLNPRILVVGEAPGENEDNEGEPFIGRAGNLLRNALQEIGVLDSVAFTNVVRCRPPDNKIDKKYIDHCNRFVRDDITNLDPEIVLLMGNVPLSLLGETGITRWNGVIIERDGITYAPLFHPAYILRNQEAMGEWVEAMYRVLEEEQSDDNFELFYPKTIQDLRLMKQYLSDYDEIVYDIETSTLDPFNRNASLLSVSIAAGTRAYAFPLYHKESWWSEPDLKIVIGIVNNLLHRKKIVGHNVKFDQLYTCVKLGMWFIPYGDSMLVSYILDSRSGIHGLKRLAGMYAGMYGYEDELDKYKIAHKECDPKRGGSYSNIPLEILLPYGARDAEATVKVHEILYKELTDKQVILYRDILMNASNVLCRMQMNGIMVDDYIAKRYVNVYSYVQEEMFDEIAKNRKVKELSAYMQLEYDEKVANGNRYNIEDGKILFVDDGKDRSRKRNLFEFNPNSSQQLSRLYFDCYNIPVLGVTKTGKPSTEGKLYRKLEDKYKILFYVRYYKLLEKCLGTYLIPSSDGSWRSDDGLSRTTFNLHTARTGRTSSSNPFNLQNIPTPEKEPGTLLAWLPVKNIFTHRHQHELMPNVITHHGRLMAADYAGMELRVFASLANCTAMLEIHRSGRDFHKMVASMVSGISYDNIDKPTRYIYKWTNWTLLYGGGAHTLHRMYDIPMNQAEEAVELYFQTFPEVKEYQEYCVEFAENNGYIESVFGRREQLPYINDSDYKKAAKSRREAMNMPTQSAASELLLIASILVDMELQEREMKTVLVNEVHDSLVADTPLNEVALYYVICKNIMENLSGNCNKRGLRLEFDWLKCPLVVDVDIGTHYGSLIPYDSKGVNLCTTLQKI